MGGWFSFGYPTEPPPRKQSNIGMTIMTMRADLTHSKLTTNLLRQEVTAAHGQYGKDHPNFRAAVAKLRRAHTKQSTTANILNQLEEAKHCQEMQVMTSNAMKLLSKRSRAGNAGNFEDEVDAADDIAQYAEEERERQQEMSMALQPSEQDLDEFIDGLNLDVLQPITAAGGGTVVEEQEQEDMPVVPGVGLPPIAVQQAPEIKLTTSMAAAVGIL